jgi:hypothetical protein
LQERAATTDLLSDERAFVVEVTAIALAEIRHEIEDENKQALDRALAGVQLSIDAVRQEITKRAAIGTAAVVELPNPLARRDGAAYISPARQVAARNGSAFRG